MKQLFIILLSVLMAASCSVRTETAADPQVEAAKALAERVIGKPSRNIEFVTVPSDSVDC